MSRDAAIFNMWQFGPLLLVPLVHFVRTRRSIVGALLGIGWTLGLAAVDVGAQLGAAAAIAWLGL